MIKIGLDNGIIVRSKNFEAQKWLLRWGQEKNLEEIYGGIELAYWRKCFNIRAKIMERIEAFKDGDHTPLTFADLATICDICEKFITKKYNWDENRGSIWDWIHSVRNLADVIITINDFIDDIGDDGLDETDFEIYFYDSY